jgi:TolB-like protein/DNA-binding winged helix-turn-helix (wHTH) protein/tetratricopeptide (TPR) repeat protein
MRVGDLCIEPGRQRVTRGIEVIALPKLSYDLLMALVRGAPNLLSIDALMGEVWPKLVVSPETVSQRVKLLRDALGDDPRNPRYVEGLRGRGYRLIPSVERDVDPADLGPSAAKESVADPAPLVPRDPPMASPPVVPDPPMASPPVVPPPATSLSASRRMPPVLHDRRLWAGIVTLALIVALIGIRRMAQIGTSKPPSSVEVVAVAPRTVAVLPFDNLSAESENDYIALGMADAVLHQLASLPELVVIARSSSFALGKPVPDAREAGRKLGARYLVEGSVQRAGNALRVHAQLIEVATNRELWSLKIDRTLDDLFALQDQIAQRVAERLDVTLKSPAAQYANFGTDAYLAFLKGRALIGSRKVADIDSAIREFSRTIELAPSFPAAYAELAYAKIKLISVNGDEDKRAGQVWSEIKTLVDRAIGIDPAAGEPYYLRASYQAEANKDSSGAEADFRKGLELAPSFGAGLRLFTDYLRDRRRFDEALVVIDRARLVDPLGAENHYIKGEVLRLDLHRPSEAAALYLQALEVQPDFYPAYTRLGQVRFEEGRLAEAIKYGEKSLAIEPHVDWTRDRVLWFYVDTGDLEAARDVARGFSADWSQRWADEALICYRAGDDRRAEVLLRKGKVDNAAGLAFAFATEAVVKRAVETGDAASARQFLLALPGLVKDRSTLAVVNDNFPVVLELATLEHLAGDRDLGTETAQRVLDFADRGGLTGFPGEDEESRAVATALLGRDEEAVAHLSKLIASGHLIAWWRWIEKDPSFTALRGSPRFQALTVQVQAWLQSQLELLREMRLKGEVPARSAPAIPGGC